MQIRPLFLAVCFLYACGNPEVAKEAARQYAKDLGYTVVGVACASTDTDHDGYVSCSLRVEGNDAPILLECTRGEWTFTGGCKGALPKLRNTTNIHQ